MTPKNITLGHQLAKAELSKAEDAISRAKDGLDVDALGETSLRYTLDQIAKAMAWMSATRQILEAFQAQMGFAKAEELARRRLADPAYTPSINEILDNPDGFLEGFREV
jgi:hypothetical protein